MRRPPGCPIEPSDDKLVWMTPRRGLIGGQMASEAITALFVPGDRPDRFGKAFRSGADITIIDLEDAVDVGKKTAALQGTLSALSAGSADSVEALVRIGGTPSEHEHEIGPLLSLVEHPGHGFLGIMVPKAESVDELRLLSSRLPDNIALIPLIESAAGLVNALEIARVPGVNRLAFGAIDFSLDLDVVSERVLNYARSQLVVVSKAAGTAAPLDSPSVEITDTEAVARAALLSRDCGFGGKLCIHPAQLAAVRSAFLPTKSEVSWARRVMAVEGGAAQLGGVMIDRPVTEQARRILRRVGEEK